jgi:hypothetical protein
LAHQLLTVYNKDTLEKQVIPMHSNCILKQALCDSTFTHDFILLIDPLLWLKFSKQTIKDIVNSDEIADTVVAKPIFKMSRVSTPACSQKIRVKATSAKKQTTQTAAVIN